MGRGPDCSTSQLAARLRSARRTERLAQECFFTGLTRDPLGYLRRHGNNPRFMTSFYEFFKDMGEDPQGTPTTGK